MHYLRAIFIVFIFFTHHLFAFVLIPYKDLGTPNFNLGYTYNTNQFSGDSNSNSNVSLSHWSIGFEFTSLAYEMNLIPLDIQFKSIGIAESNNLMFHNLRWQLFKNLDYSFLELFKPGIQLGALNLGIPNSNQSDGILGDYLPLYYYMAETQLFHPILKLYLGHMVVHRNDKATINWDTIGAVIELNIDNKKVFLESAFEQIYLGTMISFSKNLEIKTAINLKRKNLSNFINYYPELMASVTFRNALSTSKNPKKRHYPLKIDYNSFLLMEKGLLAFYESDYALAIENYGKVLKKYPTFGLVNLRLGNAYYQLENYNIASYFWKRALKYKVSHQKEVRELLKKLKEIDNINVGTTQQVETMNSSDNLLIMPSKLDDSNQVLEELDQENTQQ